MRFIIMLKPHPQLLYSKRESQMLNVCKMAEAQLTLKVILFWGFLSTPSVTIYVFESDVKLFIYYYVFCFTFFQSLCGKQ